MLGLRTEYMNMNHFVDTIAQSRMDGTFQKLLKRLDRNDSIILDELWLGGNECGYPYRTAANPRRPI